MAKRNKKSRKENVVKKITSFTTSNNLSNNLSKKDNNTSKNQNSTINQKNKNYRGNSENSKIELNNKNIKNNKNKVIKNEKADKMSNGNLGYLYYREYYTNLEKNAKENPNIDKIKFKPSISVQDINKNYEKTELIPKKNFEKLNKEFKLNILYPGLLIGSGYTHETSRADEEFKLGFFFDYTTGLPIVPGSSVKGTLRSIFPIGDVDSLNKEEKESKNKSKIDYLVNILNLEDGINIQDNKIEFIVKLRDLIFEGKVSDKETIPMYNRDIFLDAEIYSEDNNNKLFEDDYITPHKEVFKDPVPLKFLKIGPNNKIKFNFLLNNSQINIAGNEPIEISAENKIDLFKKILIDIGIGAKTKVGYGNLE
ncbi:type III-B CRISPR module RAMP protein Cmr6 [Methanococcus voltae]|uniref:CRISPR-associated RAMP protein, Cmr6 family n=1 Tax=Methanococcus voltae (strain ATCC BAA-1334 / A3) TaxID=456320 RepID=D7DST0_METV3|nr:type III-B CRISPR module RAMP protein Cmr6 [Methanococcus voltae]MCS3901791.1 CRISPR-associated protein Cmr6 [Methanococcus voltae]